jgi:hypothetical protein
MGMEKSNSWTSEVITTIGTNRKSPVFSDSMIFPVAKSPLTYLLLRRDTPYENHFCTFHPDESTFDAKKNQ